MAEVASAFVSLMPSAKGFGKKLDGEVSGEVKGSGKRMGAMFGKLFAIGAGLALGAKAVSFLGDSLGEAREAQKVGALTAQVIKSTGGAANVTAKQVDHLASSISAKTGIDDEQIASASNLLLTFKNVRNEAGKGNKIFDKATKASVDMAAAMAAASGGAVDFRSSSTMLGKALNDPVKGLSAMSRVGIQFTKGQEDQIKALVASGKQMKAQKIILKELESQFGGAAEAQATAGDKAAVAMGNLKEQVGTALLPVMDSLSSAFTTKIAPAISGFITGMQTGTGAGGRFAAALVATKNILVGTASFINKNRTAFAALATAITAVIVVTKIHATVMAVKAAGGLLTMFKATKTVTAAQWLFNAALTANPIGIVVVALAALGAALVIAYRKSQTFRNIVDGAFAAVRAGAQSLANFVTKTIPNAFNTVVTFVRGIPGKIAAIFTGAASVFYNAGVQLMAQLAAGITAKIGDAINAAKAGLDRLKGLLPGSPIKWGPLKNWNNGGAGQRLMDLVTLGITKATPKTVKAAKTAFEKIGDSLKATRSDLQSTLDGLKGDFASLAGSVASAFTGDLFGVTATEAVGAWSAAGKTVGQNFIDNLLSKKSQLTGLLASFTTLKGWGLDPAFLSQLFASGNGALITELAGMGQSGALGAATLFGEVNSLGDQLGSAVAQNDLGPAIAEGNRLLAEQNEMIRFLADDIGKQLNGAASKAQRDKKNRGKR